VRAGLDPNVLVSALVSRAGPSREIVDAWIFRSMTDETWTALADPHRRAVLSLLRERPCAVGELVEQLGVTQPTASKHLRVLREAGLVRVRKDAQRRIYTIDPGPIAELDAWLGPNRSLWNEHLDALGRHLDDETED
jgi:DNA-binding transcriptional ArsR family regulator